MNKFLVALSLLLGALPSVAQTRQDRLREHLYYFASDSLRGRKAGSEDAAKAAAYIVSQYRAMGLKPFFEDWYVPFTTNGVEYRNIVAVIPGSDPVLKDEYIVLGAHYDHVGVKDGEIYNGADDNASGSSALIEIARALCQERDNLRRSIIIAAFDAEELGLYGSNALSELLDLSKVKLMMSIDMVGWYQASGYLELMGAATIKDGRRLLSHSAESYGLNLRLKGFETSIMTATDTRGFAQKGVPTLAVTTGLKSPYHKPEDDAELIDYEGLDKISGYIADVAVASAGDEDFAPSGRVARIHRGPRKVDLGLSAGVGSGRLVFREGALETGAGTAVAAGLSMRANLLVHGRLGLRADARLAQSFGRYPDEADPFRISSRYRSTDVVVPMRLVLQTKGREAGLSAGFYGRYTLSRSIGGALHEFGPREGYGMVCGFEFCLMNRIGIGFSFYRAVGGDFWEDADAPQPRPQVALCSFTWYL